MYVAYNIFKLILVDDLLRGKRPTAQNQFLHVSEVVLKDIDEIPSYGKSAFGSLYYSYLVWSDDKKLLENERTEIQQELRSLFKTGGSNLDWLTTRWVHDTDDITLASFWNPSETTTKATTEQDTAVRVDANTGFAISGAFTNDGRKRIKAFIESIEDVLANSEIIARDMATFWSDYNQRYYQAWANFITNFDAGRPQAGGMQAQQALTSMMTTENNPYFNLLDRLGTELQDVSEDPAAPQWVTLALELKSIRQKGKQKSSSRNRELLAKLCGKYIGGWKRGLPD